jgi:hypothetical protein
MDVTYINAVEISIGCSANCRGYNEVDPGRAAQAMVNERGGMTAEQREHTLAEYLAVITDWRFGGIQFEKCLCKEAMWRIKEGEKSWTDWSALSRRRQHFKKILASREKEKHGSDKRSRDEAVQDRGAASEGPCKRSAPSGTHAAQSSALSSASAQRAAGEGRGGGILPAAWFAADTQEPVRGSVGSGAGEASAAGDLWVQEQGGPLLELLKQVQQLQSALKEAWPPSAHILYCFVEKEKTRFQDLNARALKLKESIFIAWQTRNADNKAVRGMMVRELGDLLQQIDPRRFETVGIAINVIVTENCEASGCIGPGSVLAEWNARVADLVISLKDDAGYPTPQVLDVVDNFLNYYRGITLDACAPACSMGIFLRMPRWLTQLVLSILTYNRAARHQVFALNYRSFGLLHPLPQTQDDQVSFDTY